MRGLGGLAAMALVAAAAAGQEVRERESAVEALRPQQVAAGDGTAAEATLATVYPVPLGAPFIRVQHGSGGVPDAATVRAAFASRLGSHVADSDGKWQFEDLVLEAVDGCPLSYYEFDLAGQIWPVQQFEPFTVEFGLYRECNLFSEDAADGLIAGTGGTLAIAQGGPTTVVVVPRQQVLLPGIVWLGVRFSRGSAGLIAGGAPEVGHSTPGVGWESAESCIRENLGYAASGSIHPFYNVRLFVPASCPKAHPVYANSRSGLPVLNHDYASNRVLADDALLEGGGCLMRAYEFIVLAPGVYETELRTACDGPAIAGTQRSEFVKTPGQTRVRHTFNPPIPIPQQVWIAGRNSPDTGRFGIVLGPPAIGWTANGYCGFSAIPSAGLGFSIYCDGDAPVGACCDMRQMQCDGGGNDGGRCESDGHCPGGRCNPRCRDVTRANCPYEGRDGTGDAEWVADSSCSTDPFEATCGVAACCTPADGCVELTRDECAAVAPLGAPPAYWDRTRYCSVGPGCGPPACFENDQACTVAHEGAGCGDTICCRSVCEADPWCCQVEWDRYCVELASDHCSSQNDHANCSSFAPFGPLELAMNASYAIAKLGDDQGLIPTCAYTCNEGMRAGEYCTGDSDCSPDGTCQKMNMNLFEPTWMRFTATSSSVRLSTCASSEGGDAVILLHKAADRSSPQAACDSLIPQECALNEGCGDGAQSCLCFTGLTPGELYYAILASRQPPDGKVFRLDVSSPCLPSSCGAANDCNVNGLDDDLDVITGRSNDCQRNLIPDECELSSDGDCNGNLLPDECDLSSYASTDCNGNQRPDECDLEDGSPDCDGDSVPDDCQRFGTREPIPVPWDPGATVSSDFRDGIFAVSGGNPRRVIVARWDSARWSELSEYSYHPKVISDFGRSVRVGEDQILIGAPTEWTGVVHELNRVNDRWEAGASLVSDERHEGARFGWSIAVEHNLMVVGSPGARNGGAAYVFERLDGKWTQRQELRPPNQTQGLQFGWAVSLSSPYVAVSQWINRHDTRATHLFRTRGSTWEHERSVHVNVQWGTPSTETSTSVALNDLVVGVPGAFSGGVQRGRAFLFSISDSTPGPQFEFPAPLSFRSLGRSVDIDGDVVVLGAENAMVVNRRVQGGWLIKSYSVPGVAPVRTDGEVAHCERTVVQLGQGDCNGNEIADVCEVRDSFAADCNGNRVPDECDNLRQFDGEFDGDVDLLDFAGMQGCFTGPGGSLGVADCCRIFDAAGGTGAIDYFDFAHFSAAMGGP